MRAPAGPPTVYGPNISATKCESGVGQEPPTASPEVPLSTPMSRSERLLETLAEGMQQLQQAQLSQLEKGDKRKEDETPEKCKPGTSTLPAGGHRVVM